MNQLPVVSLQQRAHKNRVDEHQQLLSEVILSPRVWQIKLKQTNIHTEERCYNEPLCWDTDHMGLFGGFGHSVTSLAVISKEPKKERLQSPTGYVTSWPIVSHQMPKLSYDCDQGCNSRRFSQYNNHSFRLNKRFIIISQNMMSDMKLDISLIYIYFLIALTGQNSIPYIIYNRLFLNHVIPQNWFTAGTLISKDHQSPFLFMCAKIIVYVY